MNQMKECKPVDLFPPGNWVYVDSWSDMEGGEIIVRKTGEYAC